MPVNSKKILVTTPLIDTWGKSEEDILFLGEWCKTLENKETLNTRKYTILKYYRDDQTDLPRNYEYLGNLYERVLLSLRDALNKYHSVNHSLRYWRILIGPWLLTYIPIIWDRWESLNTAFQEYSCHRTIFLNIEKKKMVPEDFESFNSIRSDDIWNHHLYSEIINYRYSHKVKTILLNQNYKCQLNKKENNKLTIKGKISYIVDKLFSFVQSNYKVVFVSPYFDSRALLRISMKLKQLPRLHTEFSRKVKYPPVGETRYQQIIDLDYTNDFEKFLASQILSQIPISYFEGYQVLKKCTQSIETKGSILFTANAHLCNDLFNCFAANLVENGVKLIVSQHGSAFKSNYGNMFDHQEKIADVMTVWHKPFLDNHVRLSPNKLINLKQHKSNKSNYLTLIGYETSNYAYRIQAAPLGANLKKEYDQKIEFSKHLSPEVFGNLRIQARNQGEGHTNSCDQYMHDLGIDKISKYASATEAFSTTRIIVCTYPQTTFSESLQSGIPTILLYSEEYWPAYPQFDDLILELRNNKVIFSDPQEAAKHINNIWHDPYIWWSSKKTNKAKEYFFDMCGRVGKDWANEWAELFNKQLQEERN